MIERAATLRRPGPHQIEAAIAACHAEAPSYAATDWAQIVALYDSLLHMAPSTIVRLHRAVRCARSRVLPPHFRRSMPSPRRSTAITVSHQEKKASTMGLDSARRAASRSSGAAAPATRSTRNSPPINASAWRARSGSVSRAFHQYLRACAQHATSIACRSCRDGRTPRTRRRLG